MPEIDGHYPEWEWPNALDMFGAESLDTRKNTCRMMMDQSVSGIILA